MKILKFLEYVFLCGLQFYLIVNAWGLILGSSTAWKWFVIVWPPEMFPGLPLFMPIIFTLMGLMQTVTLLLILLWYFVKWKYKTTDFTHST